MKEVYAKSSPRETLLQHTENCLKVFRVIRIAYSEIPELCNCENFFEHLFYAVFFHDFGKAATGFQKMLESEKSWNYRHEILSSSFAGFLHYDSPFKEGIALGIVTHHKDLSYLKDNYNFGGGVSSGLERYKKMLEEIEPNFEYLVKMMERLPEFSEQYLGCRLVHHKIPQSPNELLGFNAYKSAIKLYLNGVDEDDKRKIWHGNYGLFLKGLVTACDHLASSSKVEIFYAVKDMKEVYNFSSYRSFQIKASETKGNAFLVAPTGSGKTEASLFWASANQNENFSKRIFYVLPYTASINAMYDRFIKLKGFGEEKVGIQHGKANYFLYKHFAEREYTESEAKKFAKEAQILTKKIYKPYKIITPFQIIKEFFGLKGFEQRISEMVGGLFILDEIHAYDAHNTALMLEVCKVLKNQFHAKFFIMSATLPCFIKKYFQEALDIENNISLPENELKEFTRHKLRLLSGNIRDNVEIIYQKITEGKKVLVVCNQVKTAQEIYRNLKMRAPAESTALLHSRFIARDRQRIEKGVKEKYRLLVSTQVVEVSLDIDYDVLFTEPAPIDSLIQRFGRVNRKRPPILEKKEVYVFQMSSEKDEYIYNNERVEKTISVLSEVKGSDLSENLVQELVDKVYADGYSKKELEEFEMVRGNFQKFWKEILPFIDNKKNEEDFYALFNGVEVIPDKFRDDYIRRIQEKDFFGAVEFVTSITKGQYQRLKKDGQLYIESIGDTNAIFILPKYDEEFGLTIEEYQANMF
jgi:CRISPR-associated endonuclease/helicase Cas3